MGALRLLIFFLLLLWLTLHLQSSLANSPSLFDGPRGALPQSRSQSQSPDAQRGVPRQRVLPGPSKLLVECSAFTDCYNCSAQSLCHFCEQDHKCHAYGSVYGCTYGVDCYDIAHCVRSSPSFEGYGEPELATVLVSVFVAVVVILCPLAIVKVYRICNLEPAQPPRKVSFGPQSEESLSEVGMVPASHLRALIPNPSAFALSSFSRPLEDHQQLYRQLNDEADSGAADASRDHSDAGDCDGGAEEEEEEMVPLGGEERGGRLTRSEIMVKKKKLRGQASAGRKWCAPPWCSYRNAMNCTFVLLMLSFPVVTVVILFYPQMPSYSLCSRKVDWGSVLSSISHLQAAARVEMLFSVYNPNRFDIDVAGGNVLRRSVVCCFLRGAARLFAVDVCGVLRNSALVCAFRSERHHSV